VGAVCGVRGGVVLLLGSRCSCFRPASTSERWGLSCQALEKGARNGVLPCYLIGEEIRFDPIELDRWARDRGLRRFMRNRGEGS
jgi:hypothetical protein